MDKTFDAAVNRPVAVAGWELQNMLTVARVLIGAALARVQQIERDAARRAAFGEDVVPATVSYTPGSVTATLTPSSPLAYATPYTAAVTTGAKDLAGNALAADFRWTFATTAPPPPPPKTLWRTRWSTVTVVNTASSPRTTSGPVMIQGASCRWPRTVWPANTPGPSKRDSLCASVLDT